jgi:exonuclease VII large subunit
LEEVSHTFAYTPTAAAQLLVDAYRERQDSYKDLYTDINHIIAARLDSCIAQITTLHTTIQVQVQTILSTLAERISSLYAIIHTYHPHNILQQ